MDTHRWKKAFCAFAALVAALTVFLAGMRDAAAVPSFARKYKTSCITCHTVYPMLNSFGEAFRRDGYRFPSQDGSADSDNIKDEQLALGQAEYKKMFPDAVWPDQIQQAVPLSLMVNGNVAYNFPDSDAHSANGNAFTWNGVTSEVHLFGAGAFTDALTYFSQLTVAADGVDIETAYLLMNDIVGPRHLVNLWVGRLFAPQLTSFGLHSSYLNDTVMPATSIAGLYNPTGTFTLGQGHSDGIEVNGIVAHRVSYAVGWLASGAITGITLPTAEDAYAHIGVKIGGMSLDGEGPSGMNSADAKRPWADTALTLDAFAYHGLSRVDSGTGISPTAIIPQDDAINAAGGQARLGIDSFQLTAGAVLERHEGPYQGSAAAAGPPPAPGTPEASPGTAFSQYAEADYVIYPWLVPGVRTEFTRMTMRPTTDGVDAASFFRVIPGVAIAIRPNVRLVTTATFEHATGLPPAGSWGPAGGNIVAPLGTASKVEAEQINATLAWAF